MTGVNFTIDRVNQFIDQQASLDTLRFITCGSVDDGKSTLIGRMLFESHLLYQDQLTTLVNDSKRHGTQGGKLDFALLVDGLAAEREQGITIDVAYRFFSTQHRKFIVADTPGHEQYTRNMVTGASTADLAIILIDAGQGVLTQTRRHTMICSLMGVKNLVIAINKMDLVDYKQSIFENIVADYQNFTGSLGFTCITPIPISALHGDNVLKRSNEMQWYQGPTLLSLLETIEFQDSHISQHLRFPVQWVNRPHLNFRGYSGTIESGMASVGQLVRILPSGESATIKEILLGENSLSTAEAGRAVTLLLDREVDISRGDIIVARDVPCDVSDHFEVKMVWLDKESGYLGRDYWLKLGTTVVNSKITTIKHKLNINTFEHLSATRLELNDITTTTVMTDRSIAFEPYSECPPLGSFILIDRMSNLTVAAGMIEYSLRRANNVHRQYLDINKRARRSLNNHTSKVLWFTGLSGAGKSTIANGLEKRFFALGIRTYILDGDNIRQGLNNNLGFTDADRIENIRRVAEVAKLMVDAGLVVIVSFISPFQAERQMAREMFEEDEFIEVFVDTPLEIAEKRDPKGLYKKARAGEIPNFTAINSPFEAPTNPEIWLLTESKTIDSVLDELMEQINISS